jgi:hypothetical protein
VEVSREASEHPEAVAGSEIVPSPPFAHQFVGGEYALARGASPGEPWRRVVLEAVGPEEAVVVDVDGRRERMSVRALVPLTAPSR